MGLARSRAELAAVCVSYSFPNAQDGKCAELNSCWIKAPSGGHKKPQPREKKYGAKVETELFQSFFQQTSLSPFSVLGGAGDPSVTRQPCTYPPRVHSSVGEKE